MVRNCKNSSLRRESKQSLLTDYFKAITEQEDERESHGQLRSAAEVVFAKLWDNKEDEVWNEYLEEVQG
jgi:hypothetical protein